MHLVRLVVLGSPGVGKTTLIENFLSNCVLPLQPSMQSQETREGCRSYDCSVLLNDLIVQVKIIDVPPVSFFPSLASSSLLDWTDREGTALKSADGFILVFDLTSPASFQFLKMMRDQLIEGRGKDMQKTPLFVIGNKADCILASLSSVRHHYLPHHHHHSSHSEHHSSHHHHHHEPPPAFKELAALVRKQWKSSYWEVSALHQWRLHSLFMRILEVVTQQRKDDQRRDTHDHHHHHHPEDSHPYHHHHHVLRVSDQSHPQQQSSSRRTMTTTSSLRRISQPHDESTHSSHSSCVLL